MTSYKDASTPKLCHHSSRESKLSEDQIEDISQNDYEFLEKVILNPKLAFQESSTHSFSQKLHSVLSKLDQTKTRPSITIQYHDLSVISERPSYHGKSAPQCNQETILSTFNHTLSLPKAIISKLWGSCGHSCNLNRTVILNKISGQILHGTMTLVLGKPGSGKSTFLKTLGQKLETSTALKIDGDITYNGRSSSSYKGKLGRLFGYVSQFDKHYSNITPTETMAFANMMLNGRKQRSQLPDKLAKIIEKLYENQANLFCHLLDLDNCKNTMIGDGEQRGISGGEKKRLSLGEILIGNYQALFLDEISNGLDSISIFKIIKYLHETCKIWNSTIIVTLQQPTPEVYELFDDVILLEHGEVIYHGPRCSSKRYFEQLGYICPIDFDEADFLIHMTDPVFRNSLINETKALPSFIQESKPHFNEIIDDQTIGNTTDFSRMQEIYGLFYLHLIILYRSKSYWVSRLLMAVFLGLLYGSAVFDINLMEPNLLLGICFSVLRYSARSTLAQVPLMLNSRPVFYKHHNNGFYHTSSYVIAYLSSQTPLALIEALVFGSTIYWMCGLVPDITAYLTFISSIILTNNYFMTLFFTFTCSMANIKTIFSVGSIISIFIQAFSGFMITRQVITIYWIWLYWMNPVSWMLRAIAISQYMTSSFQAAVYNGINYLETFGLPAGKALLFVPFGFPSDSLWITWGFIMVIASTLLFCFISIFFLQWMDMSEKNTHGPIIQTTTDKNGEEEWKMDISTPINIDKLSSINITFNNIKYCIHDKKKTEVTLLHEMSGYALSGRLTALMGPSGAGKSTLLDVLAGRKTIGKLYGNVLFNGHNLTIKEQQKLIAYCEQVDVHFPKSTVLEILIFNYLLRQGIGSDENMDLTVGEITSLLQLGPILHTASQNLSQEENKRLSIACELVSNPTVFLLDEPTTGLDASSARRIIQGLQRISQTGKTIICTIHQPSNAIFKMFDDLVLLKHRGMLTYMGPIGENGSVILKYLDNYPNHAALSPEGNIASYVVDVLCNEEYGCFFLNSEAYLKCKIMVGNLNSQGTSSFSPSLCLNKTSSSAFYCWTKLWLLLKRSFRFHWRSPDYNYNRFVTFLIQGLVLGSALGSPKLDDPSGVQSTLGFLSILITQLSYRYTIFTVPVMSQLRPSFYIEHQNQMYSEIFYALAILLPEIPYTLLTQLIYTIITSIFFNFGSLSNASWFWLVTSLMALSQEALGYFLVLILPSAATATIGVSMLISLFQVLSGFDPPSSKLGLVWKYISWVTPLKYAISAIIVKFYGSCPLDDNTFPGCTNIKNGIAISINGSKQTIYTLQVFIEEYYGMKYSYMYLNIVMLLVFYLCYFIMIVVALRYFNYKKC